LQPSKAKKINLVLFGGLGNQLFQYFAGQYLAQRSSSVIKVDSTVSQLSASGHSHWIDELTLPEKISPSAQMDSWSYLSHFVKRRVGEFLARLITDREWQLKYLRRYRSLVVGYDPRLEVITPPVRLEGYFQTYRYYQALKDQGLVPEILMKKPSAWLLDTSDKFELQGKVLGIHVRRGDYVGNSDIGTLSVSYYEAAIQELKSRGVTWDAIWVFSDDVSRTQNEFRNFSADSKNFVFVEPPTDSHSFESLMLMSRSSSLIIANSTYSWWAATLGNPDKIIACPSKWFAQMEDPQDLRPESWIQIPSAWVNLKSPF
jgi:hypothetical protein